MKTAKEGEVGSVNVVDKTDKPQAAVAAARFEYQVLEAAAPDAKTILADAGAAGWELVSVTATDSGPVPRATFYFKRRK